MNNEEMSDVFNKFMNNMNSSGNVDSSSVYNLMNMLKNNNKDGNSNISPEAISNLMQMLQNNNTNKDSDSASNADNTSESSSPQIDMDILMKMKSIIDQSNNKSDPRANLLLSLKPYLKESRKSKVEQCVQLFNMSKMFEIFNKASGGDNAK